MQLQSICNIRSRRRAVAGAIAALFASLPFLAGAHAAAAAKRQTIPVDQQRANLYTVINLGPELSSGALNERGQVAINSSNYFDRAARFFDGERLWPIGSLGGGGFTFVNALNERGVVVGASATPTEPNGQAFSWTLAGGIRALPGPTPSAARDINDRNEIVGFVSAPGVAARAFRWNADGSTTPLGPLPALVSEAFAINNRGYSTGYTTVANGEVHAHATLWDPAGAQTDLGPTDGGDGFGLRINERNDVAGVINYPAPGRAQGFFWSRDTGRVAIDAGPDFRLGDLNNRGEVVGTAQIGGRERGFQWTLGRGVVPLPLGPGVASQAYDINDRGEIVGSIALADGGPWHAARWPSYAAAPIDLNTQLYRAPAGLELRTAWAINESGAILADSNAGLVLLRPGRRGTDAPVLGPIIGLPATVEVGQDVTLTLNFVDNAPRQTHTASATWTDGCPSSASTVTEADGTGQVRLQHRFCAAGYHAVKVVVTDSGGRSTELWRDVIVVAPGLASLSGAGTLAGVVAAAAPGRDNAPLRFALWTPLGDASAGGAPVVRLAGPFQFLSEAVTRATSTGMQARVEGTGRLNGRAGYRFVLDAIAGGATQGAGADRLRVRVTHADAATGAEVVDYDNGAGADRTVVTEGGLALRH
jgi:uncharacterized membrane protein